MLLEILNALFFIEDSSLISDLLNGLLLSPELLLLLKKNNGLQQAASQYLYARRDQLLRQLQQTAVPSTLAEEVRCYQQQQALTGELFNQRLAQTLRQLQTLASPFASQAQQLIADNPAFTPALQALFMQRWRGYLVMQVNAFNQQILDVQREQLLREVKKRITLTHSLLPVLAENDNAAGKLWDMSGGKQSMDDYQLIIRYGDFLASQPELVQLAQQLGRSRRQQPQPDSTPPQTAAPLRIREPGSVPEQLDGLRLSDDILRLLPAEQATFAIAELEYEFYRRMLDKTLLTYRLYGEQWREKKRPRPLIKTRHRQQQGAFLICVDCSGSMGGFNERCAKAFCLALTRIALAEQRACFIFLFSTELVSYQPLADQGLEPLNRFLSQRFRGGTDLTRCLAACVDKLHQQQWHDADVVVISDFIAQRLPAELIKQIHQLQPQHRFHALATSPHGKAGIMRIFDYIWRFDTSLRGQILRKIKNIM